MAGMGLAWLLGVALQLQERSLLPLWAYLLSLPMSCPRHWKGRTSR